eukprot:scaffold37730_cov28-Tisochrysis_lutea.AAC.3
MISTLPPAGAPPTKCATAGGLRCQCPDHPGSSPAPVPCHPEASCPVAMATVSRPPPPDAYPSDTSPPCKSSCHHVCKDEAPSRAAVMVIQFACAPHCRMKVYWSATFEDREGNRVWWGGKTSIAARWSSPLRKYSAKREP